MGKVKRIGIQILIIFKAQGLAVAMTNNDWDECFLYLIDRMVRRLNCRCIYKKMEKCSLLRELKNLSKIFGYLTPFTKMDHIHRKVELETLTNIDETFRINK